MTRRGPLDGRTLHYGAFYGARPWDGRDDDRPRAVVWGNCQAEALRLTIDNPDAPFRTVRVPPVHELSAADVPYVRALMRNTTIVISQPVRAGYRGLPIGTDDLVAMSRRPLTVVRWPVVRYCGLYPFQVIVRDPDQPATTPPVVPYHDLRTIVAAHLGHASADKWDRDVPRDGFVAAALWSVEQLRRREVRDTDVGISDILLSTGATAAHTINHPGNPVLIELGRRVSAALGARGRPVTPEHELLGHVRAPLEHRIVDALEIDGARRPNWIVGTDSVSQRQVVEAQASWYRQHPVYVSAALHRYAELIDILGLFR